MPRSRSPSGQRPRYAEQDNSKDTRKDRRDYHSGRRHADDLQGERRRFDDRRPNRDEKPMNGDRRTDYNRSNGRGQDEDRDRHRRDGRDQRRDRGNDGERERERDRPGVRDRDRDRAGPSRRSASPPPRTSRPRSAKPTSPSVSRSASPVDKAKPNFAPSGLLAADTNTVKAVDGSSTILKYNEPPEARKPVLGWRLYVFKGSEQVGEFLKTSSSSRRIINDLTGRPELLHIHRQSAYLIGRDRLVADIAVDHPSCSKQHAVIQCAYFSLSIMLYCNNIDIKKIDMYLKRTNLEAQRALSSGSIYFRALYTKRTDLSS